MLSEILIESRQRNEMIDITDKVSQIVSKQKIQEGMCIVFVPHTTAAITINEGADQSVKQDILEKLSDLVPKSTKYKHTEGNSDAHIKASIIGSSVLIPIIKGHLFLGNWQSIFFCEFDGPRNRKAYIITLKA